MKVEFVPSQVKFTEEQKKEFESIKGADGIVGLSVRTLASTFIFMDQPVDSYIFAAKSIGCLEASNSACSGSTSYVKLHGRDF